MQARTVQNAKLDLRTIRHPMVNAIGGINAAIEHLSANPQLAEKLLRLALQKFGFVLEQIEREGKEK